MVNAPNKQVPDLSGQGKLYYNGYFPVVAWLITIGIFVAISRTKIGYTILFFFVLASMVIVLAIGSPTIVQIFSFGAIAPQGQSS